MNNTSSAPASFSQTRSSLPAADSSGSSSQARAEEAAPRPGTMDERTRSSSSSPAREQTPPHRPLHQMAARLPQPGELEGEFPGSPRRERKTDADRETKHPAPARKRHREEPQEQSSGMASLAGPREPDKKARAQAWVDPEIQAFLERHPTIEGALEAAFALESPSDSFLERLSQGLRDELAKSSSYAQAVQTVACEIGLKWWLSPYPDWLSPYPDAHMVVLLRGLLREWQSPRGELCTQDLPEII